VGRAAPRQTPRAQAAGGRSTRWGCGAVRDHTASPGSPSVPTPEGVTPVEDCDGAPSRPGTPLALAQPQPRTFSALAVFTLSLARNLPTTPVGK